MTKRKATAASPSTLGAATTPQDATIKEAKAQIEMIKQEHRQYLTDSAITASDTLPPANSKKKPAAKKPTMAARSAAEATDTRKKRPAVSKTAIAPDKPATKKRKASDASVHDSATEATSLSALKKRKPNLNKGVEPSGEDARDESLSAPTKRQKRPATSTDPLLEKSTTKSKPKPKHSEKVTSNQPLPPPLPSLLSATVAAKVERVRDFVIKSPPHASILERHPTAPHHISIPELSLKAVLMRLRIDYMLADPAGTSSEGEGTQSCDAQDIIVSQSSAPVHREPAQPWVTLDLSRPFRLGQRIHDKISGHGLEGVNLLETELEMHERERRVGDDRSELVSGSQELRTFFDGVWRDVQGCVGAKHERMVKEANALPLAATFGLERELPGFGVCPAAPAVVM